MVHRDLSMAVRLESEMSRELPAVVVPSRSSAQELNR